METKLYKGKVILKFDEKKHIYTVNDKIVYGVTSITGMISKPVLINWVVKLTKEKVYSEAVRLGGNDFVKNLKEVLLTAGKEHYSVSKEARELGIRNHDKAEKWLAEGTDQNALIREMMQIENTEERLSCSTLLEFFNTYELEPIELEGKIYSKEHEYAGTLDYYGKINKKLTVMDYKTSKAIYSDYVLQLAAYAQAKTEEGFQVDQIMIVRLGKDGVLEVKIEKDWKKYLEPFLGALSIKNFLMDIKSDNFDKRKESKVEIKKVTKK